MPPDHDVSLPGHQAALEAVRTLLRYIGDDPARPGLADTPERVLRAWRDSWGKGYTPPPRDLLRLFENGAAAPPYDQMVVVSGINFYSTCEHHMAPFFGTAAIAYIPSHRGIVGLSKLARVVDHFARQLQVQERLTAQIADFLEARLAPDIGVSLQATHLCMVSRGVQQPNALTATTALKGRFLGEPATRAEFLRGTHAR